MLQANLVPCYVGHVVAYLCCQGGSFGGGGWTYRTSFLALDEREQLPEAF